MAEQLIPTGLYTTPPVLQAHGQLAHPSAVPAKRLPPGSIDQAQFQAALASANAGAGSAARESAVARSARSTPTLTLDQFLALTGSKGQPAAAEASELNSPPPLPSPESREGGVGATAPNPLRLTQRQLAALQEEGARQEKLASTAAPSPAPEAPLEAPETDPVAAKDEDGVIILRSYPDKDQREALHGKKWRVEEDPRSRALFFGEDGKFGFDDFLDLINPLQHIPLLNIAYRNLTGDQISGASKLLGAIPFGPVSVLASVTDPAITSTNGQGMAETAVAALFGGDEPSPATGAQLAELPGGARRGSSR